MIYRSMIAALMMLALEVVGAAHAQQAVSVEPRPAQDIKVVTRILPPMVVQRDGNLSGFAIELWNEIVGRLNLRNLFPVSTYVPDLRL